MNLNNLWKTYELSEDSKINFRSIDFEIDSESNGIAVNSSI